MLKYKIPQIVTLTRNDLRVKASFMSCRMKMDYM